MKNIGIGVRGQLRTFFIKERYDSFINIIRAFQKNDFNVFVFFNIDKKAFYGDSPSHKDYHFKNLSSHKDNGDEKAELIKYQQYEKINNLNADFEEKIKKIPCDYYINYYDKNGYLNKKSEYIKKYNNGFGFPFEYQYDLQSYCFQMLLNLKEEKNISFENYISCRADIFFKKSFIKEIEDNNLDLSKTYYMWDLFRMHTFSTAFKIYKKNKSQLYDAYDNLVKQRHNCRLNYKSEESWQSSEARIEMMTRIHEIDIPLLKNMNAQPIKYFVGRTLPIFSTERLPDIPKDF